MSWGRAIIGLAIAVVVLAAGVFAFFTVKDLLTPEPGPLDHVTVHSETSPAISIPDAIAERLNSLGPWGVQAVDADQFAAFSVGTDGVLPDFSHTTAMGLVTNIGNDQAVADQGALVMLYFPYHVRSREWLETRAEVVVPVGEGREDFWIGSWAAVYIEPDNAESARADLVEFFGVIEYCSRHADPCEIPEE